jgi:putative salt-induced outer membrane protein YdiY
LLKRHLWLGLVGFGVWAVWAYAQTQLTDSPPADVAPLLAPSVPPLPQQPPQGQSSTAPKPTPEDATRRWYAPEIWRLPPVVAPPVPVALAVPPAETFPSPSPSDPPPKANVPASLSGILSVDEPIKINAAEPTAQKLWDGSFDLGIDGAEGNSETFNFRFGFHATRKQQNNVLTLGVDYNRSTAETITKTNRLFFDGRFERLIQESRWSWFVHETVEYDQFQAFDVLDTSDIGLGYRLIKNETATLVGRFGSGFSHQYGGPKDGQYVPEAVFGMQLEWQVSKRQRLLGMVEYAPSVTDFGQFRLRSQAALEMALNDEKNLSLRMGILELYNSMPNGARPNDLDYALTLHWSF